MTAPASIPAVSTVEKFVNCVKTGDLAGACELIAPNAVLREADSLPWGGEWRGPDGFAALIDAISTPVELLVAQAEIFDAGEFAVVRANVVFVSRQSGRRLPMTVVEHYTVGDGRICGAEYFYRDTQLVNELVGRAEGF